MNYKITHTTTYAYSSPVSVCHNLLMLTPREGARVKAHAHRLLIRPTPTTSNRRTDAFGNYVHCFSIEEPHRRLSVTATSRVTVESDSIPPSETDPAWEAVRDEVIERTAPGWLEGARYRFDSPRITRDAAFADFARPAFEPGKPAIQSVLDLTALIHREFAYDQTATHVHTKTEDVLRDRRGVCQDFAHVQLACLRSLGIPARYVSGYLRTVTAPGQQRLVGADQSHAWVSVYCGETIGWQEFDPTNNCQCDADHVPLGWGRDYGDVVPFRGVFTGGGEHALTVSVDVRELDGERERTPGGALRD